MKPMKFKVTSDQQSIDLQNTLFRLGCTWLSTEKNLHHIKASHLFVSSEGALTYTGYRNSSNDKCEPIDTDYFKRHSAEEQNTEKFILDNRVKTPHIHSELMIEYAQDTSIEIEILAPNGRDWVLSTDPSFVKTRKYRKKPKPFYPRFTPDVWGTNKFDPDEVEKILKSFVKSGAMEGYYRAYGVDGLGKQV